MPPTNAERFEQLESIGVLSPETGDRMQSAAGFRNVLAHRYGDGIDDAEVYSHLQNELNWLVAYLREVREVLGSPKK